MTPERDPDALVLWPAERFYWAALDAPGWTRSGPLPEIGRAHV